MNLARACGVAFLLVIALPAYAAITCTASVTSVSVTYDPTVSTQNVTTGSYTINCTRLLADPNTFAWTLEVNDGLHAGGGGNNVQSAGGQQYSYETYRASPYNNATKWGTGNGAFSGTLNFGGSTTASTTAPFDIVMDGNQTVQPAGTYSDTLTATLRENTKGKPPALSTPTFSVTVNTTANCQIQVPPGSVSFTYTAFQGSAATANTPFGVRCTTSLPYTMALDVTSGTLLGLNYSLAIAPSTSSVGTGLTQNFSINGTIAPGQAGTCATSVCSGSQTRTLTLSW